MERAVRKVATSWRGTCASSTVFVDLAEGLSFLRKRFALQGNLSDCWPQGEEQERVVTEDEFFQ